MSERGKKLFYKPKLLVRRLHRRIYVARSAGAKRVLVKVNSHVLEARREMRVMKAYGRTKYLVELLAYKERKRKAFIVMEWVRGKTLQSLIKKRGVFTPAQVVAITDQVLKGLQSLHRLGFVHGDLHAGNVMVYRLKKPKVKLIDMQMAVRKGPNGRAKARRRLPRPPAHLAPESNGAWIDDRYDIYGVGFMMACMLVGKVLKKPVNRLKRNLSAAPLWTVVCKAVDPDPRLRYPSAVEMAAALRSASQQMKRRSNM